MQHTFTSVNCTKNINTYLGVEGTHLELKEADIQPTKLKRQMYKNFMNGTVGKFSQKPNYTNTTFVSSAQDIEDLLQQEQSINDFTVLGEDVCEVQTRNTNPLIPCRKTNPVIGSFVTALSRIDMHRHIMTLKTHGFRPLYTDTDSLIFCGDSSKHVPLPISNNFGEFRKEYTNPTAFCCIGKKNYAVSLSEEEATKKPCVLKIRGLSLKSTNAQAAVNFKTFENFLSENSKEVPVIPQVRVTKKSKSFQISHQITHIKLATSLNFNRILTKSPYYATLPYGYVEI